jgi:hypothetical protein
MISPFIDPVSVIGVALNDEQIWFLNVFGRVEGRKE